MPFIARSSDIQAAHTIAFFGTGQAAQDVFKLFAAGMTDKDVLFVTRPEFLDHRMCFGLPVMSLQEAVERYRSNLVVVVAPSAHKASQIELLNELDVEWRDSAPIYQLSGYFADRQVKEFIDLHVNAGNCALDVDANVGVFSSYLASLFDAVHCFEPSPTNMKRLRENLLAYPTVNCHELAVSDKAGRKTFFVDTYTPDGSSSTFERRTVDRRPDDFTTVEVEVTTVDAFCTERDLRPSFIKIDAEGRDFNVLRGARTVIESCRPHLVVEFPEIQNDLDAEQILSDLHQLSKTYRVLNLHTWRDIIEIINKPGDIKNVHHTLGCQVINLGCLPL